MTAQGLRLLRPCLFRRSKRLCYGHHLTGWRGICSPPPITQLSSDEQMLKDSG